MHITFRRECKLELAESHHLSRQMCSGLSRQVDLLAARVVTVVSELSLEKSSRNRRESTSLPTLAVKGKYIHLMTPHFCWARILEVIRE